MSHKWNNQILTKNVLTLCHQKSIKICSVTPVHLLNSHKLALIPYHQINVAAVSQNIGFHPQKSSGLPSHFILYIDGLVQV